MSVRVRRVRSEKSERQRERERSEKSERDREIICSGA